MGHNFFFAQGNSFLGTNGLTVYCTWDFISNNERKAIKSKNIPKISGESYLCELFKGFN